jgi:para-nitrobenzyl esterase
MMTVRRKVAALVCAAIGLLGSPTWAASEGVGEVVRTDAGPVRGTVTEDYRTFRGIPFAAPPVGELRWAQPRPPQPWTEPRDATKPGSRCAQKPNPQLGNPGSDSEDCLYLNVTTPRTRPHGRPLPVMVWLHGGGFIQGSGSDFDARRLAVQGEVVVVTINYRLGVFGFFGYPGLAGSGAFGLADQQEALRWVQRNAVAFGGDPRNVTVFGESAGGISTCGQLTSPTAAGLFHRAVMQSGACTIDWPDDAVAPGVPAGSAWGPPDEVQGVGATLATRRGCTDPATAVACLRRLPVSGTEGLLVDPLASAFSRPGFGNDVLPVNPVVAMREGQFHHVPVMIGTTRDEQRLMVAMAYGATIDKDRYRALLAKSFGDKADRVAERYPVNTYETPGVAWAAVTTDRIWSCNTLANDRLLAKRVPTYGYEFADRDAPSLFPFPPGFPPGAYHGAELQYLFREDGTRFTPEQVRLSERMIRYWARFAHTGDPNGPDLPHWSRFRSSERVQSFAPGAICPVDLSAEHRCDFWASVQSGR